MSGLLDLERELQCGVVLQRALLGRQAQIVVDEPDVDSGPQRGCDHFAFGHATGIQQRRVTVAASQARRNTAIGDVRAMRSVPTHPANATSAAAAKIKPSNDPIGGT